MSSYNNYHDQNSRIRLRPILYLNDIYGSIGIFILCMIIRGLQGIIFMRRIGLERFSIGYGINEHYHCATLDSESDVMSRYVFIGIF